MFGEPGTVVHVSRGHCSETEPDEVGASAQRTGQADRVIGVHLRRDRPRESPS